MTGNGGPPTTGPADLSVVVPCYGTAQVLPELLDRLVTELSAIGVSWEVILVDDCSPDGLGKVAEKEVRTLSNVRYLELMFNVGQFRALMCGLAHATGRFVITMDDDLQHPPEEIGKLYSAIVGRPDVDAVFGAYGNKQHAAGRNLGSLLVRTVNTRIFGKPRDLVMSSFRCLRRELVDTLVANHTRYPVIGPLILSSTRRIINVPVRHDPRKFGQSTYSLARLVRTSFDNILNFSALPLQLISIAGVLISMFSFIVGAVYLVLHLVRGGGEPGWTSLFLAINFYGGLGMLAVGVIGEYLIRILGESKGQPLYVVRRQLGMGQD